MRISDRSSVVCSSELAPARAARSRGRDGARRRSEGMTSYRNFGVVGGGAWGTALAQLLAADGATVRRWAREEDVVAAIQRAHRHPGFLPGAALSPSPPATVVLADMTELAAPPTMFPVPLPPPAL